MCLHTAKHWTSSGKHGVSLNKSGETGTQGASCKTRRFTTVRSIPLQLCRSRAEATHGRLQRTRALHRRPAHSAQGEPRGGWSRAGRWHTPPAGRPQQCCLDRFAVRVRPRPSLPAAVYTSQQPPSRLAREAAHGMRRGQ